MKIKLTFGAFLMLFTATALRASDGDPLPSADTVVSRMLAHEVQRQMLAAGYHGLRRYVLDNERMHKHAEMLVRVQCDADGRSILRSSTSGVGRGRISTFCTRCSNQKLKHQTPVAYEVAPESGELRIPDGGHCIAGRSNGLRNRYRP